METKDPKLLTLGPGWTRKDGYIIGVAVAAGESSWYFPVGHQSGNLPKKTVYKWLQKLCDDVNITKIFHNALYDLGWLRAEGIEVKGKIIDTMIAAPLLDENRRWYNLNSLARDYLGEYKDEKLLKSAADEFGVDPKSGMWKLPPRYVGKYAEQDALITLKLWDLLKKKITQDECSSIFELETSLLPVLFEMKTKGVLVDIDKAQQTKKELVKIEESLIQEIVKETGVTVEPWVATSVAKVFDAVGLSYSRTEKSGSPMFTKQFLSNQTHPIAKKIIKIREINKANTTFVDTILEHSHNGRIHWVHYCATLTGIDRHPQIDDVVKMYHEGNADFHQMVADMANIRRKKAKTVNVGIMYGMGKAKLANVMDIDTDEASKLLETYNERVPFLRSLSDKAMNRASSTGIIRTWLGRKCRFDMYEPVSYGYNKALPMEEAIDEYGGKGRVRRAFTYKALNRLIQGSSADQTKKAMVECYKEGLCPMLTVHDELCFNIKKQEEVEKIKDIMSNCVPNLKIPFEVDAELGENWGEVG